MADKARVRAEAARLMAGFTAKGAVEVDPPILQPAETLLDLYGEDIRARAYVTADPVLGEAMLRPDFTVPVVQMHMGSGAEPARYTYAGEVFRAQEEAAHRAPEYIQVGYELFDGSDPGAADAEVFALIAEALEGQGFRTATGDIGLIIAAVNASDATLATLKRLMADMVVVSVVSDWPAGYLPIDTGFSPAAIASDASAIRKRTS